MSRQRFVVHVPVLARDLGAAKRFARAITRALGHLPDVDAGETTVSEEDAQFVRHRVFCDARLDGGRRCRRLADHDGPCTRRGADAERAMAVDGRSRHMGKARAGGRTHRGAAPRRLWAGRCTGRPPHLGYLCVSAT